MRPGVPGMFGYRAARFCTLSIWMRGSLPECCSQRLLTSATSAAGSGLRTSSDLALPGFIASVSVCSETVHQPIDVSVLIAFHESTLAKWNASFGAVSTNGNEMR